MERKRLEKFINYASLILLIFSFLIIHYFLYKKMDLWIDSDLSAEMILAKIMKESKEWVLSNNWHYSTEIRIVNTQLLFSLLFRITDNWKIVRIVGTAICCCLFLLSFIFLEKKAEVKYPYIFAFLILGSISKDHYCFILINQLYTIYVIYSFLIIGFLIDVIKGKASPASYICIGIIAFFSTLCGKREIAVLYAPLFATCISIYIFFDRTERSKRLFKACIIVLGFALFGYMIYSIALSKRYPINSVFNLTFKINFHNIKKLFISWGNLYGIDEEVLQLFRSKYISICLSTLLLITTITSSIKIIIKNQIEDKLVALYFLISCFTTSCVFAFTDMYLFSRYLIINQMFFAPVIAIYFRDKSYLIRIISSVLIVMLVLLNTATWYLSYTKFQNYDLLEMAEILKANGIKQGYASYWQGNVLTELTNGEIEIWCYGVDESFDPDKNYAFLQSKEHDTRKPNDDKQFLILSNSYDSNLKKEAEKNISYKGEYLVMYIFESKNELYNLLDK